MNTYIFTFGIGSDLKGNYQPILANDYELARNLMLKTHGTNWAFGYSQEEFEQSKQKGFFLNLTPLKLIEVKEAV